MSQHIQGEGEFPLQDARSDLARRLKLFFQNTSIIIPLVGITSLYIVTASGRSSCSKSLPGDPGGVHVGLSRCKISKEVLEL